jgi:hypothetical protein
VHLLHGQHHHLDPLLLQEFFEVRFDRQLPSHFAAQDSPAMREWSGNCFTMVTGNFQWILWMYYGRTRLEKLVGPVMCATFFDRLLIPGSIHVHRSACNSVVDRIYRKLFSLGNIHHKVHSHQRINQLRRFIRLSC